MILNKIPLIIRWWVTPKLPIQHIFIPKDKRPKELIQIIRVYLRKWGIHPIKRRLARYYVWLLQKFFRLTVIGITGSCGKTTTKEMLASILKRKGKTVATHANIDPIYNIPTTILRCSPLIKYLILEMGVEYPGEMDFYLWLAKPDIGVITNIFPTHTEFLGDRGGVFQEKKKLVESIPKNGAAILNREDNLLRKLEDNLAAKIIWFGNGTSVISSLEKTTNDYQTEFLLILDQNPKKRVKIKLPVLGRQYIYNALAASATAHFLGVSPEKIKAALENYPIPDHRMNIIKHRSGAIIFDDSYNSNPMAAKESIDTFITATRGKERMVVFGDMLELGQLEEEYHRKIGKYLGSLQLDYLIGVGKLSLFVVEEARKFMKNNPEWVEEESEVYPRLKPHLTADAVILIKGSRSIGLDRTVSKLS